ncbi:MAG: hypothetical protein M1829_005600 [Trizodia sp. TS-e1964]|nr:MAG: hypothetical protein M1829_005600 [Trizodia sp. TS-e1964]
MGHNDGDMVVEHMRSLASWVPTGFPERWKVISSDGSQKSRLYLIRRPRTLSPEDAEFLSNAAGNLELLERIPSMLAHGRDNSSISSGQLSGESITESCYTQSSPTPTLTDGFSPSTEPFEAPFTSNLDLSSRDESSYESETPKPEQVQQGLLKYQAASNSRVVRKIMMGQEKMACDWKAWIAGLIGFRRNINKADLGKSRMPQELTFDTKNWMQDIIQARKSPKREDMRKTLLRSHGYASGTKWNLDRTSSTLLLLKNADKQLSPQQAMEEPSTPATLGGPRRPDYFLGKRTISSLSASSSIREVMQPRTPSTTPCLSALYRGPDDQEYFKVEIADTNGPAYLPSEARKVSNTPRWRLSSEGSDRSIPVAMPTGVLVEDMNLTRRTSTMSEEASSQPSDQDHLAWDVSQWTLKQKADFDFSVPDHLPGSPLCPASSLKRSRWKGVCIYHGRKRV